MRRFVFLVFCTFLAGNAQQASTVDWGYYGSKGPSNWYRLDPSFSACGKGKEQSPIEIRRPSFDSSLRPVEFHYVSSPLTLLNTGYTIQGIPVAGGYIVVDGIRYDLQQFHFHHPAEQVVNGKLADVEVHLVHRSATGEVAVLAVRMNEGRVSGALASLWPSLSKTKGASSKIDDPYNPLGLIPADRSYYSYRGSLSVPPCTEGVRWIVFERVTELSGDQLANLAYLYPDNARPVQALHGRKVTATR